MKKVFALLALFTIAAGISLCSVSEAQAQGYRRSLPAPSQNRATSLPTQRRATSLPAPSRGRATSLPAQSVAPSQSRPEVRSFPSHSGGAHVNVNAWPGGGSFGIWGPGYSTRISSTGGSVGIWGPGYSTHISSSGGSFGIWGRGYSFHFSTRGFGL